MSDELPTLVAVSRSRPRERRLCCPRCGGEVVLRGGLLHCVRSEREGLPAPPFRTLAELALKIGSPNPSKPLP